MQKATEAQSRSRKGSVFLLALFLFAAVNAALVFAQPLKPIAVERIPAKPTWESQRTDSYMKGVVPDAVLFGSSLMMIPIACRDADYLQRSIDPVLHPYSQYMHDRALSSRGQDIKCFNFALPGGMISDHYMIVSSLFTDSRKPKLAVFGLSLRDFIDSGVECAAATPAYCYFSRYKTEREIDQMLPLSMPSIFNRGQYLADRYFYLFGKRLQLQVVSGDLIKALINSTLRSDHIITLKDEENKPDSNPNAALKGTEVRPGMLVLQPDAFYPWQDNTREYKKRFKGPNTAMFDTQSRYFDLMLSQLHRQSVKVMLVNMPLTESNMKLMPRGSYDKYLALMHRAARGGCIFIDLNDGRFVASNFKDPVHMNGRGGKLLIDNIVDNLPPSSESVAQCGGGKL